MGKVSMPQGKGSQLHNRREYERVGRAIPDNIDVSKSPDNITLVDRDIRQAYEEIFGESLRQYNSKQKRADRKIASYYDHIQKSKNGEKLFYEDVVQWGQKEDFQDLQTREKVKEALVRYAESFEKRNPNLKLVGAYIHMDEASPHLHLDYVPVAHGYSRGLPARNSLDRAMKEMGFVPHNESRKNNATKIWKENERAYFGGICRSLGLEVESERKSTRKNLSVEEYKDARDEMLGDVAQERDAIAAEVKSLRELKVGIDEISDMGMKLPFGIVAVKAKELEIVMEQAKAYAANRDEIKTLRGRSAVISQREQRAEQKEQQLDRRADELARQQEQIQQMYQRQLNLNQLLERTERDKGCQKASIALLEDDIAFLTDKLAKTRETLGEQLEALKSTARGAYESLAAVVQAVGMLKYDENSGYRVEELTPQQSKLIDSIAEYGAKWAKKDGFPEIAEDMEKYIGISNGIKKLIEPKQNYRSYDYGGPEL